MLMWRENKEIILLTYWDVEKIKILYLKNFYTKKAYFRMVILIDLVLDNAK